LNFLSSIIESKTMNMTDTIAVRDCSIRSITPAKEAQNNIWLRRELKEAGNEPRTGAIRGRQKARL